MNNIKESAEGFLAEGELIKGKAEKYFYDWPKERGQVIDYLDTPVEWKERASVLEVEVMRWMNGVKAELLPHTMFGSDSLTEQFFRVQSALRKRLQKVGDAPFDEVKEDAMRALDKVLNIVRSIPPSATVAAPVPHSGHSRHVPNTAFILMWMDKARDELDDVVAGIKDVCGNFGIAAVRADDVEHQEQITEVVLERIRSSEFLIADLSGERPNVY